MTAGLPLSRSPSTDLVALFGRPKDPDIGMNGNLARSGAEIVATVNHECGPAFCEFVPRQMPVDPVPLTP